MELGNKKLKQAYFGGNKADLTKEVKAPDVKSAARVFSRENNPKDMTAALMANKAQSLTH